VFVRPRKEPPRGIAVLQPGSLPRPERVVMAECHVNLIVSAKRFMRLSGGLKQRLSIALALIGSPQIAILDELTTGLDPQARRDTWELIEHVRDRGVTVILVTHFMDEAERLCDRVMLIDRGKVAALDTPAGLAERAGGGSHLQFVPSAPFADQVLTILPEVAEVGHDGRRIRVTGAGDLVSAVIRALGAAGVETWDIQVESARVQAIWVVLAAITASKVRLACGAAGSHRRWHEHGGHRHATRPRAGLTAPRPDSGCPTPSSPPTAF
jgi:ABC-2 type transport system ATP-binding protein